MKIKHEIELLPWVHKSKKRSNGKAPLFIRVSIGGQNTEVSLNLNITPENWITQTKTASKAEENYKEINFKIQAVKIDLKRRYDELCLKHGTVYPIMVKNAYLGKSTIGGHPLDSSLQNKKLYAIKSL